MSSTSTSSTNLKPKPTISSRSSVSTIVSSTSTSSYRISGIIIEAVHFHVHGKVQGVYFRKHTQKQAALLNLRGWVRNNTNAERSVEGIVQGTKDNVEKFKTWVSTVGSPSSRIDRCTFTRREVDATMKPFEIKK
ncbi:hypothetical protein HDU97_002468 [Phlyctochytrium planicorne]|nr:hypothetical protein HDU97_002468 [Phlyctochytrium planicorne]